MFLFPFFFFHNFICLNSCFAVVVIFSLSINIFFFCNFVTLTAVFCYLLLINTFSLQFRHINRYWIGLFNRQLVSMVTGANKNCKIVSLNVRGIRDPTKRRGIFSYLKDQKVSFYFLQATYSESSDENVWRKEWGGEVFFSHGSTHSRGVCILVVKVDYSFTDNSGRIVLITLNFDCLRLSLCNIYAPNNVSEQLQFIQELKAS